MAQTKAQLIDGKGAVDLGALSISGSAPDNSVNLDASGRFLVGTSSAIGLQSLQLAGGDSARIRVHRNLNDTFNTEISLSKARGTGYQLVSNNDWIGSIEFEGADGSTLLPAARIRAEVDGTPGANDMPGRLVFSTTADGACSPTERMRIGQNGLVSITAVDATESFRVGVNSTFFSIRTSDSNGEIRLSASDPVTGSQFAKFFTFYTSTTTGSAPTEKVRIANDGTVLFGQATNPATSTVVVKVPTGSGNGVNAQITSNTGTSYPWSNYNASGTYVGGISCTSTATSFPTSSDYRLKTNIQPLVRAINLVSQLKPSTFEFNENPGETVQGFIAHELQEVVPLAVIGEKDAEDGNGNPIYQGVDAAKLVPLLTAALQEAVAKIESLEARLTAAGI